MVVDPERLRVAKVKIGIDQYDVESWQLIIKDAQSRRIDEVRDTFEHLVQVFPTSGRFWKMYIEQEIKFRNYEKVEKLFQRCLIKVLNMELWKTYLQYVRETKVSLHNYKEKMAQAYDFAVDKIGMDIASYPIWNEYVNFLKSVEAVGSYAENQKITAIRKVYQRGTINPMSNIEMLWKDYVSFEMGINSLIAEKLTSERSRDYMNARRVAKEYEVATRGINKSAPCIPPSGSIEELKQVELWHKYIAWEKSNPMRVEDTVMISKRVVFAYEQCLLCLGHHPSIWYEVALFLQESAKLLADKGDVDSSKKFIEQASSFYERGINGVLKKCTLLHFAYADFEEQQMKYDKVHQIYLKFLDQETIDPTLCYVQYMKFCRRCEGTTSARAIFKKAREDPRSTYHVYVAAALMEYYCTKDKKIAGNVFELGFKKFKSNPNYILEYIDYLSHLNEDNNTRVLFERSLTSGSLTLEESIHIWDKFLEFESKIGDLSSIIKVEKRRAQLLSESPNLQCSETAQLIDRYKFLELVPCTPEELCSLGYVSKDSSAAGKALASMAPASCALNNGVSLVAQADNLSKPDLSQMLPFKPKVDWKPGEFRIPGGAFSMPPASIELCQNLPPPESFHGPFVIVDKLIEVFLQLRLPEEYQTNKSNGQNTSKLFDVARSVQWSNDLVEGAPLDSNSTSKKRHLAAAGASDDEDVSNIAPINDIYRKRQQKKMK